MAKCDELACIGFVRVKSNGLCYFRGGELRDTTDSTGRDCFEPTAATTETATTAAPTTAATTTAAMTTAATTTAATATAATTAAGVCAPGCDACGYNWYERNWNNGNPSTHFTNADCGCCGGTTPEKEACKIVCVTTTTAAATTAAVTTAAVTTAAVTTAGNCAPSAWTGYDGQTCGGCSALVNIRDNGGTCEAFCAIQGLPCVDGWDDERSEQCSLGAARLGCDASFGDSSDAICQCSTAANVCSCDDGTAATGADCANDGNETCASCNDGFYVTDADSCAANVCSCDNGTAATGADCANNGVETCASCNDGFYVTDADSCAANVCSCNDGTAAKGADCANNGAETCASCNDGFYVTDADSCAEETIAEEREDGATDETADQDVEFEEEETDDGSTDESAEQEERVVEEREDGSTDKSAERVNATVLRKVYRNVDWTKKDWASVNFANKNLRGVDWGKKSIDWSEKDLAAVDWANKQDWHGKGLGHVDWAGKLRKNKELWVSKDLSGVNWQAKPFIDWASKEKNWTAKDWSGKNWAKKEARSERTDVGYARGVGDQRKARTRAAKKAPSFRSHT